MIIINDKNEEKNIPRLVHLIMNIITLNIATILPLSAKDIIRHRTELVYGL